MIEYVIFWTIAYLVLGIFLYYRDRKFNVKIYRFFHNYIRRPIYKVKNYPETLEKLEADSEIGFIHGQDAKRRYTYLLSISFIQSAITWYFTGMNPIIEVLISFGEAAVALIGMAIAPSVFPFLQNKDDAFFNKVDEIEKKGLYKTVIKSPWEAFLTFLGKKKIDMFGQKKDEQKVETVNTSTNEDKTPDISDETTDEIEIEEKPAEPEVNARDLIKQFTEGRS